MKDLMRVKEFQTTLPAEYWETEGAIYGALVEKVSPDGLLILSVRDMPVGTRLNVRIFYAHEYELEGITVVAKIVWKSVYTEENWRGYKYGLDCVQLSEQKLPRLNNLGGRSGFGVIPEGKDIVPGEPMFGKECCPPLPDSEVTDPKPGQCGQYKDGKCLKTHTFCDLCQTADEIVVSERASSAKKSRSRGSSPFTSGLAKLAGNFKSAFGNY